MEVYVTINWTMYDFHVRSTRAFRAKLVLATFLALCASCLPLLELAFIYACNQTSFRSRVLINTSIYHHQY